MKITQPVSIGIFSDRDIRRDKVFCDPVSTTFADNLHWVRVRYVDLALGLQTARIGPGLSPLTFTRYDLNLILA